MNRNEIIDTIKEKWLNIIIASVLVYIIGILGYLCLIIPGIILTFVV